MSRCNLFNGPFNKEWRISSTNLISSVLYAGLYMLNFRWINLDVHCTLIALCTSLHNMQLKLGVISEVSKFDQKVARDFRFTFFHYIIFSQYKNCNRKDVLKRKLPPVSRDWLDILTYHWLSSNWPLFLLVTVSSFGGKICVKYEVLNF